MLAILQRNKGCGICIAVCPWSRPGGPNLWSKRWRADAPERVRRTEPKHRATTPYVAAIPQHVENQVLTRCASDSANKLNRLREVVERWYGVATYGT